MKYSPMRHRLPGSRPVEHTLKYELLSQIMNFYWMDHVETFAIS